MLPILMLMLMPFAQFRRQWHRVLCLESSLSLSLSFSLSSSSPSNSPSNSLNSLFFRTHQCPPPPTCGCPANRAPAAPLRPPFSCAITGCARPPRPRSLRRPRPPPRPRPRPRNGCPRRPPSVSLSSPAAGASCCLPAISTTRSRRIRVRGGSVVRETQPNKIANIATTANFLNPRNHIFL